MEGVGSAQPLPQKDLHRLKSNCTSAEQSAWAINHIQPQLGSSTAKVGRTHHECECRHVAKTGPALPQSEQLSEAHASPMQADPVH